MLRTIIKKLARGVLAVLAVWVALIVGTLIAETVNAQSFTHEPDWHAIVQTDLDNDAEVLERFLIAQGR